MDGLSDWLRVGKMNKKDHFGEEKSFPGCFSLLEIKLGFSSWLHVATEETLGGFYSFAFPLKSFAELPSQHNSCNDCVLLYQIFFLNQQSLHGIDCNNLLVTQLFFNPMSPDVLRTELTTKTNKKKREKLFALNAEVDNLNFGSWFRFINK